MVQEETQIEVWKDIPSYEGMYQVSTFGRVKSLKRKWVLEDTILIPNYTDEYPRYGLSKGKPRKLITYRIHYLVAVTFIDKDYISKGLTVNHKDGNKLNNNLDNLEIVTYVENLNHARKTGLSPQIGETHTEAKLTKTKAKEIRELSKSGLTRSKIATMFSVSRQTVDNVVNNKIWKNDI